MQTFHAGNTGSNPVGDAKAFLSIFHGLRANIGTLAVDRQGQESEFSRMRLCSVGSSLEPGKVEVSPGGGAGVRNGVVGQRSQVGNLVTEQRSLGTEMRGNPSNEPAPILEQRKVVG